MSVDSDASVFFSPLIPVFFWPDPSQGMPLHTPELPNGCVGGMCIWPACGWHVWWDGTLRKGRDASVAPTNEWFHFVNLHFVRTGIVHGCTGETTRPEPPSPQCVSGSLKVFLIKVGKNTWSNSPPSFLRNLAPRPWPNWYRQFKGLLIIFMACLVLCLLRKTSIMCSFFHREALLHHPSCRFPRAELQCQDFLDLCSSHCQSSVCGPVQVSARATHSHVYSCSMSWGVAVICVCLAPPLTPIECSNDYHTDCSINTFQVGQVCYIKHTRKHRNFKCAYPDPWGSASDSYQGPLSPVVLEGKGVS